MLADGAMSVETQLLISAATLEGVVTMADLEAYMKTNWLFPSASRAKSKLLWQVFRTAQHPTQEKLKASASEMLGVYSLLRHFVDSRLQDAEGIALQKASFQALSLIHI